MTDFAIHPPVHVVTHPDEPIRSLEAAEKYIRRHVDGRMDARAEALIRRIDAVRSSDEAEAAGRAFLEWAASEGLLLVPPEDAPHGKSPK
jgi:hypothetical protein